MTPRFSIIENTTPHLTFAEDVSVFGKIGAEGIGIIEKKISDYGCAKQTPESDSIDRRL
jgi:hypothetical protein